MKRSIDGPSRQKLVPRVIWPLIWLAGLSIIIACAPAAYHQVGLAEGEKVAGFRGRSHELMMLTGGKPQAATIHVGRLPASLPVIVPKKEANFQLADATGMYFWNCDTNARRDLFIERGGRAIQRATTCASGNRLCIEYGSGEWSQARLVIVDAWTGRSLRTVNWLIRPQDDIDQLILGERNHSPPWSISDDGTRLAYCERVGADLLAICVDADCGRVLHKFDPLDEPDTRFLLSERSFGPRGGAKSVLISPDGKYLAIEKQYGAPGIVDLERHCLLKASSPSRMPALPPPGTNPALRARMMALALQEKPESFSRDSRFLIELDGKVRDILADKITYDAKAQCIFVEGGKKVAALTSSAGGSKLVCYDIEAGREVSDRPLSIPENVTSIEAVGDDGNLIRIDGTRHPADLTWVQKALNWLGFKQTPSRKGPHRWRLVDARSGTLLQQGWDQLLGIGSDGRYVVTGDHGPWIRVYRHPLRGSISFLVCAGAAWTVVLVLASSVWRRRLGPYFGFR